MVATNLKQVEHKTSKRFLSLVWAKRSERLNDAGVSTRSRNNAPSLKGKVPPVHTTTHPEHNSFYASTATL